MPFRARPTRPVGYDIEKGLTWPLWLVDDQREAFRPPDVLAFTSDVLTAPVKISGQPVANLVASTSGTDSDWVVKLIDVYPDEVAGQPEMGGYQLVVSMDIFRGRYRESLETPKPITADKPLVYRFELPTANHVFLPGHRIMVQVQSSWFPLYDRNPQTFVPNIFWAKPGDYKSATQHIWHSHQPGHGQLCGVAGGERAVELQSNIVIPTDAVSDDFIGRTGRRACVRPCMLHGPFGYSLLAIRDFVRQLAG